MPLQPTISHEAKVLEITAAAMQATMQGKAYVFVEYAPHVNGLFVWADSISVNYDDQGGFGRDLFASRVRPIYLDWSDAAEKLEAILNKIKEL